MKVEVYKNIDLVQIDITAGKSEYRLPRNVDWANRKVDKLLLVAPEKGCLSPLDGITPVLTRAQIEDMYFDLFRADESEIAQNLYFENLLYTNNHPVRINSALSLKQARINFSTPPTESGCILLYVFWGGSVNDDYQMPSKSETVSFDLAANEKLTFTEIINTYFHVRGEKINATYIKRLPVKRTSNTQKCFRHYLHLLICPIKNVGYAKIIVGEFYESSNLEMPFAHYCITQVSLQKIKK